MQSTQIISALALKAKNTTVTSAQVQQLLADVKGVTFAQITSVTDVKTSAKHKGVSIKKVTCANVQLFNNLKDFDVYAKAVKRDAGVEEFVTSETWFEHTGCFSLVAHKQTKEEYLYAIYNTAKSAYIVDGVVVDKQQVAQYLTASEAAKLTQAKTYNVTNGVEHGVTVRVLKLASLVSITAQKQTLTV